MTPPDFSRGPLSGIRVLDLTQVLAGPLATQMLAEQGADVIKVEGPLGDILRLSDPQNMTGIFANCNRGKRSIVVDFDRPGGVDVLLDLARTCDVFFENFRPAVAGRLGVGYEAVRAVSPDIIYCSVNGFGATGPYAERPALDPVIQALCGMVAGQESADLPFPDLIRTMVADKSTAYTAAQAITAALFARQRGAPGQHLQIAMLDAAMAFFWPDGMSDKTHGSASLSPMRVVDMYQLVDTADGKVVYFAANSRQFEGIWRAFGRDDLAADPMYTDMRVMASNPGHLVDVAALMSASFESFRTVEIVERMAANSVPCGPVLSRDEALVDPQLVHNETLAEWEHPTMGRLRQPRPPVRFSTTPTVLRPQLNVAGSHTAEILAEIGYSPGQIESLTSAGVVATGA